MASNSLTQTTVYSIVWLRDSGLDPPESILWFNHSQWIHFARVLYIHISLATLILIILEVGAMQNSSFSAQFLGVEWSDAEAYCISTSAFSSNDWQRTVNINTRIDQRIKNSAPPSPNTSSDSSWASLLLPDSAYTTFVHRTLYLRATTKCALGVVRDLSWNPG